MLFICNGKVVDRKFLSTASAVFAQDELNNLPEDYTYYKTYKKNGAVIAFELYGTVTHTLIVMEMKLPHNPVSLDWLLLQSQVNSVKHGKLSHKSKSS